MGGQNPFPPEDCGGAPGYMRLLSVWNDGKDPHGDADYEEWASGLSRNVFGESRLLECLQSFSAANRAVLEQHMLPRIVAVGHRAPAIGTKLIEDLYGRIAKVLADFDREHGVASSMSSVTHTSDNGQMTVETAIIRDDGIIMDRAAAVYQERAAELGLSPDWLGQTFLCGKDHVRIIGLKPRAKESVLLETVVDTGQTKERFKMHPDRVPGFFAKRSGTTSSL